MFRNKDLLLVYEFFIFCSEGTVPPAPQSSVTTLKKINDDQLEQLDVNGGYSIARPATRDESNR